MRAPPRVTPQRATGVAPPGPPVIVRLAVDAHTARQEASRRCLPLDTSLPLVARGGRGGGGACLQHEFDATHTDLSAIREVDISVGGVHDRRTPRLVEIAEKGVDIIIG